MIDILVATCADHPELEADDRDLLPALEESGITARPAVWSDPSVDWTDARLCALRMGSDPSPTARDLRSWIQRVDSETALLNPAPALEWSLDRGHVRQFDELEVPTIPTLWLEAGGPADLEYQLEMTRWSSCVIRPARGRDQALVRLVHPEERSEAGQAHLERVLADDHALIHPHYPHLAREGMLSLVFLGGSFSHAVRRRDVADEPTVELGGRGASEATTVSEGFQRLATAALAGAPGGYLWASVDLITDEDGAPCVRGVELVEPRLELRHGEGSVQRLAAALQAQLTSAG